MLDVGAEVLDDDVGPRCQLHEERVTVGIFQVDADAALVAMQVLLVGSPAGTGHRATNSRRRFDPDDIRSPVRQQPDSGGTGTGDG